MAVDGGLDLRREYVDYLARFEAVHGPVELGKFVKYEGRLVKKQRFEEFEPLFREYAEISKTYLESIERGDTINDVVVKLVRQRASELLLPSPV